ncbi:MAG: hypothetical protein F9K24_22685 [Leptonema illini]|uniref:Uncharacterized protein n=1 Tax=Leptonema illini TaxID=183 RepID=A0A833LTY7_9LEPT|nr:MAG: hypothetical protein F9K24_22685 [Leptonema illini]
MIDSMLNRFWVDDASEKAIISLIETTPGRDALPLLNGMKKGAFAKLERSIDGDNYYQYHLAIQRIYFSALQPEAAYRQMMKARKFPWSDPGFIAFATGTKKFLYDAMELTGQGKIRLQIYPQQAPLPFSMHLEYELDALEMIQIEMFTGTEELRTKIGDHIYTPAITLFALKNTPSAREARFVLDFSLLAIGGAGLVAAKTIPAVVLAAVDIALGAGDMAVNEYRSVIAQSESGKRFLSTWDTVQFLLGVYGLARLLKESPRIFLDLRRLYREYRASKEVAKNPELIRELNQKLKGIVDDRELEQYLDEAGKKRPHADPAHPTEARKTPTLESHGDGKPHITYAERKFLKARAGAQSYILRLSESKNGILDLGKSIEGKRFLDIFHDMNDMFQVLNREIGLVRTRDGKFLMLLGELPSSEGKMYRYTLNKIQDMKDAEIIAHTHIKGASKLSNADYEFLLERGQKSTYLIITEDSVVKHNNIGRVGKRGDSDIESIAKLSSLE